MKHTTAGKIGDAGTKHIGKTIEFPDFHGRSRRGVLDKANSPRGAVYASLTVDGKTSTVFRDTPVTVIS